MHNTNKWHLTTKKQPKIRSNEWQVCLWHLCTNINTTGQIKSSTDSSVTRDKVFKVRETAILAICKYIVNNNGPFSLNS